MIAEPPTLEGATNEMLAVPFPEVADPITGAPGTLALTTTLALAKALAKLAFPACVAVSAQVPTPTTVSVLPLTVHTVFGEVVAKVNVVSPLVAVAVSVIGATPTSTGVTGAKVTVCEA